MIMLKIVTRSDQAIANIYVFESEVAKNPALQDRLPYARAWYAHRGADGQWHFGYQDIDAAAYLKEADQVDGRRTEAQLQSFFSVATEGHPVHGNLHAKLHSALVSFLAKYGKTPSTKARISVKRGWEGRSTRQVEFAGDDNLVRLLVAVASKLPEAQLRDLREQLEDVWA
jgi:hypothetical protein